MLFVNMSQVVDNSEHLSLFTALGHHCHRCTVATVLLTTVIVIINHCIHGIVR